MLNLNAIKLRPNQIQILEAYRRGGKMGIFAVPGSGKTFTLSLLAADIIASGDLDQDQEILIVTLVNSAVENFARRIEKLTGSGSLLTNIGYRVRTLHGLAHDIVRECPSLVNLADNFQIIDEHDADDIRDQAALAWLHGNSELIKSLLSEDVNENRFHDLSREHLPTLIKNIARNFIRYAKDLQLTPEELKTKLDSVPAPLYLAEIGWNIYADYQRALAYRGAVDFDDLISMALQILQLDSSLVERLRERWPFILEDEAQDSSRLQEKILNILAGPNGNWVRVGDPNQAIFETFTTANPIYLREFIARSDVIPQELPVSGRSTQSIIDLANSLIDWTMHNHPVSEAQDALAKPFIELTDRDDPQPNPSDALSSITFIARKFTPDEEIAAVARSVAKWLPEHTDQPVAILSPRNKHAFLLVDELKKLKVDFVDSLLASTTSTRATAGTLVHILKYLSDPQSANKLSKAYQVWRRNDRGDDELVTQIEKTRELLKKCTRVEDFIAPVHRDWLDELHNTDIASTQIDLLYQFKTIVQRWQKAIQLPIDQLILTLAQDLFIEPVELAVANKLAVILRQSSDSHPTWRLPELIEELGIIARNERRFMGFSDEDTGFNPGRYQGKVVLATVHKAKGLEWDRVYLMSVNNYDFPSGMPEDQYQSERWFIRDRLNLEAETLAQLDTLVSKDKYNWYEEGIATQQARIDYVRERLRLLYVGITRAKKELIITWNSGKKGDTTISLPLLALMEKYPEWTYDDFPE